MIQTIITCDICGTDEKGPYPKELPGKYWRGEVAGGRWYKLSIYAAPAEGAATSDVTIDVCPECAEKLADQLGITELPPLVEQEEEQTGLTITSPVITTNPFGWREGDTSADWRWVQYTNTTDTNISPMDIS